jgi:hypothetical protein
MTIENGAATRAEGVGGIRSAVVNAERHDIPCRALMRDASTPMIKRAVTLSGIPSYSQWRHLARTRPIIARV